ncbi:MULTISPECIES: hypothetical protein [Pectobacteriaceae]|uniref:hypothetical protein n=1 Tax=Pectobacteriaceae TaxID=1903410 RepID=UPI001CC47DAB|nr:MULTISPECIES: hypothetical protein [Pectobacteriaceae]MDX5628585.1 hypothetical protein [Brenneria sp. L3-3Z]MDX5695724.1 hypothetical protein [Brenneria sp. L4-2C]MEE3663647.1 hypothetical protein [Brenneria sp. g21c3]
MSLIRTLPFSLGLFCAAEFFSAGAAASLAVGNFTLSGVSLEQSAFKGEPAFKMTMPSSAIQDPEKEKLADRNFMAWLPLDFGDGVVEVDVASQLVEKAPAYARGFIGLTFRIDSDGRFESIYLRPTNSIAEDQVRRNHSVQYVAYPDYKFDRLRQESPEKYESYAELGMERWIHMKIVVTGQKAVLYLDRKTTPSLIVNDLKLGANQRGGVGVWLESGTVAFFRNLTVTAAK